jgi:hypothetical protein
MAVQARPPTVRFCFNCGHRAALPRTAAGGQNRPPAPQQKHCVGTCTGRSVGFSPLRIRPMQTLIWLIDPNQRGCGTKRYYYLTLFRGFDLAERTMFRNGGSGLEVRVCQRGDHFAWELCHPSKASAWKFSVPIYESELAAREAGSRALSIILARLDRKRMKTKKFMHV